MSPAVAKGKRKREFSEEDMYLLLHRCTPATILTVLQEVAQHAGRRNIDWTALVAKTATGITSAREYQMLWRYFAYRHDLADTVDASDQPLGDESDLECEIEPVPTPSNEALAEASEFAKILLSGSSHKQASNHHVNSEAPALGTPNKKIRRVPSHKQLAQSHRLTNGTGPVSSSKQASNTGLSLDPFDGNRPHKNKNKSKPWSTEEDADLTAGVHKCGEGNWPDNLHKYNCDKERTPAQLSQRCAPIKQQRATKPANAKSVSEKLDIKTTQNACFMAVDKLPMNKPLSSTFRSGASQSSIQHPSSVFGSTTPEIKSATAYTSLPVPVPMPVQVQQPHGQIQQAPAQVAPLKVSNTLNKSRSKKQAAQPNPASAPSSIQEAAIAAGARVATPSVANSLFKAAQSTKAVHVRSGGTWSSRTCASSKTPPTMTVDAETQLGSAQHRAQPSNAPTLPSSLVSTTHAIGQVAHIASEPVVGVNPLEESEFYEVKMEDLFPEDIKLPETVIPKAEEMMDTKDAGMLEFDRYVANLGQSKTVKTAPQPHGVAGSQKQQPKLPSTVDKSIPLFARIPATMKRTKSTTCPPQVAATSTPTMASSGLVGTGTTGVLSKAVLENAAAPAGNTARQNRCRETSGQKQQHPTNSKSNVVVPAKNVALGKSTALGSGVPARNVFPFSEIPIRNVVPYPRVLSNSKGNLVVNDPANKGDPPASQ